MARKQATATPDTQDATQLDRAAIIKELAQVDKDEAAKIKAIDVELADQQEALDEAMQLVDELRRPVTEAKVRRGRISARATRRRAELQQALADDVHDTLVTVQNWRVATIQETRRPGNIAADGRGRSTLPSLRRRMVWLAEWFPAEVTRLVNSTADRAKLVASLEALPDKVPEIKMEKDDGN